MTYRGATFTELDADAVIARHPRVALIDELAHTNIPGSRNAVLLEHVCLRLLVSKMGTVGARRSPR